PGVYNVSAALEGFKALNRTGYNVSAGNPIRVDLPLDLGTLAETVDVVAETTLLQTEKADLNTEISAKAVTNLPLNQYRNYQTLLNLVPGATPTQFQNAEIDTPARSLRTWVNGTQPNANTTRVDGAVSVNVWLPHHAMYIQSAESIDTVNVSTNNFDADTGMAAGAAQTVITKSGTNQLRGSAFYFLNDDSFNSNTYFNKEFKLPKPQVKTQTFGGTLGGPILKNKLFYFGSWERYDTKRPTTYTYSVPTAKMRAGDFSEVAAAYPAFRLFNPNTGTNGTGRDQFTNNVIPSNLISPIAVAAMRFFPAVNSTRDLNSNLLLDDYTQLREEFQLRDNVDFKVNYQLNSNAMVWGKFGMMDNQGSGNSFVLGFDNPSTGDTRVYLGTFGTTWTLGPTAVLDANIGISRQNQTVLPPDYGTNYGLDLGIRGVNDPTDIRNSGLPTFASTYTLGSSPNWMPLWRKETSYSGSIGMTKVFTKHEMRVGADFVRLELNHRQAEWGNYGLKGGFSFSNNTTGAVGYTSPGWNSFAAFLMGLPNYYAKDTQTEEMTGRENQVAFYLRDRWTVSQKLTVSAGVRMEYYPLMTRDGRGIEILDYNTYTVSLGGIGNVPNDVGINLKEWYFVPRVGAAYRLNEKTVIRAGYGATKNPLPWSRPMRGSFPFDINNNASAPGTYEWVTTLANGIPSVVLPDMSSGKVVLPRGVYIRSPNPNQVDRGTVHQWNISFERRLPGDISAEIAYVGTATDGGYADLNQNVGVPGGGGAAAKYFAVAGTTAINDWASRTKSRYKGLQMALNRPFKNGLMLKGAYTWSQSKNMADEDGWTGLTWNYLPKYDDNFAIAGFDRTHVFQMGWVYELPFLKNRTDALGTILGGWQVNGVGSWYTGTPYAIGGTNNAMACQGCGAIYINVSGDPKPTGTAGSTTEAYY
ncbi:MAG: TonB-dependent receptor, partial [Vicinamibacterales bacterium]|nr:TonB-dependent receptor [Vicinamibacterales bacterium]